MSDQSPESSKSSSPGRYIIWIVLAGAVVAYLYASRPSSAPPPAFAVGHELGAAFERAAENNQLVLIDFYADWCPPCKYMDREVFPREDVADALSNWVVVKIDVDEKRDVANQYNIQAMPTLVIARPDGTEITRVDHALGPDEFIKWIRKHSPEEESATQPATE